MKVKSELKAGVTCIDLHKNVRGCTRCCRKNSIKHGLGQTKKFCRNWCRKGIHGK